MAARRHSEPLGIGSPIPDLRLPSLEGGDQSLATLTAGRVLLVFFKISCPVCQFTLPYVERIHAAGTLPVYAISQNDAEDTREFNREFQLSLPALLDREEAGFPAGNAFHISSVPTLFLAAGGAVSRVLEGWSRKEMEWLGEQAGIRLFRPGDYVPEWKAG